MTTKSLVVNEAGAHLSYSDSGAPSMSPYVTVFAIHGMCFTNGIFKKVSKIVRTKGFRFVSVNRRNFGTSSSFTPEELSGITKGDDDQRHVWLRSRGQEIITFMAQFIQQNTLPEITTDGKSGGVTLLGWSAGASIAMAALSSLDSCPASIQTRFAAHLRTFIAQEPAPVALGLPTPPRNWVPLRETTIPEELRFKAFAHWITSYFDHGDLTKRDLDTLSYVLASQLRPPSIFSMSIVETNEMLQSDKQAATDLPSLYRFADQLKVAYRKVCFDKATAKLLPKTRIVFMTGTMAPAFSLAGLWAVEHDEKEAKSGRIDFKVVPNVNHFMHWDDTETTVATYPECMNM